MNKEREKWGFFGKKVLNNFFPSQIMLVSRAFLDCLFYSQRLKCKSHHSLT